MTAESLSRQSLLLPEQRQRLLRRHVQGAYVRVGASIFMWLYAYLAHTLGVIQSKYIIAVTVCVVYLILINPPHLWILRQIRKRRTYELASIVVNFLEIVGYTAIIYTMGGINALYLSPIYAALIAYVGAVSPPRVPFIIASLAAVSLLSMGALQYLGIIPAMETFWRVQLPRSNQIVVVMATICLLYVVAFIISYTAGLLRNNKMMMRDQNRALEKSRTEIKQAAELVEKKNCDLKAALERAQESEALKAEFLANMSHELRTPLNHIIGFTELVLNPRFGELNPMQREYLSDVHNSGRHLLALINDILDFSKIEAGKLEIDYSRVNVRMLVESCVSMVSAAAKKKAIELSSCMDGAPEEIIASEVRLKQIVSNLMSNAVKFTPSGGRVTINVKNLSSTDVFVEDPPAEAAGQYLQFAVSDTGVGLNEKDIAKVFRSFEQVKNHAALANEGTGLGLAIAKNLVELHGGKIWVDSPGLNRGSTFAFILPIDRQHNWNATINKQETCSRASG